jgi:hypothetical protein
LKTTTLSPQQTNPKENKKLFKAMKKHFAFCVFGFYAIASAQIAEAVLPQEIPVAAVFDEEGDPKLQLAFVHGVDRINQDPTILPGKMLVPQIVMIPAGKR